MKPNDKPLQATLSRAELEAALDALRERQSTLQQQLNVEHGQLQQLAKRLWLQQEDERARLARELHDDLGQQLTGIATQLAPLQDDARLQTIYQQVRMAIETTRNLSRMLHPTLVQDLGLKAGIQWLARQLLAPANIDLQVDMSCKDKLPHAIELFFFRIIQEAMVNTVKYAEASRFELFLRQSEGALLLLLRDNGKGFTPETVQPGVGLQSMRDRAQAFGALFELRSAPQRGCEIQVQLPFLGAVRDNDD